VFSTFDSGIGAAILPVRATGDLQNRYALYGSKYVPLDWKWNDLISLMMKFCQNSTLVTMAKNNNTGSIPTSSIPMGFNDIVVWISKNNDIEVRQRCLECAANASNASA
jgi:hypothetical protein